MTWSFRSLTPRHTWLHLLTLHTTLNFFTLPISAYSICHSQIAPARERRELCTCLHTSFLLLSPFAFTCWIVQLLLPHIVFHLMPTLAVTLFYKDHAFIVTVVSTAVLPHQHFTPPHSFNKRQLLSEITFKRYHPSFRRPSTQCKTLR